MHIFLGLYNPRTHHELTGFLNTDQMSIDSSSMEVFQELSSKPCDCQRVYHLLVSGLEHEFYDFPYIGNHDPN